MLLRRLWIVLAFLLVPAVASADAHRAGAFGGGSYLKASSLLGYHFAGDVVPIDKGVFQYITLIGDFSIHAGSHNGSTDMVKTTVGGPGFAFAIGDHVITGHALFGDGLGEGTVKVTGGSWEYLIHRLSPGWQKGLKVQVDRIFVNDLDDAWRISVGAVFRYKRP
jgi:hypothetical protein